MFTKTDENVICSMCFFGNMEQNAIIMPTSNSVGGCDSHSGGKPRATGGPG